MHYATSLEFMHRATSLEVMHHTASTTTFIISFVKTEFFEEIVGIETGITQNQC